MQKHYVVLYNWTLCDKMDDNGIDIIAVVHTLEEAKAIFAERVANEKKYAEDNDWVIFTDTDVEFDACGEGFCATQHDHFYIQEVE